MRDELAPLDRVIDEAARSITSSEPPAALRDDVRARVQRRPPWVARWMLVAAATAAMVILAVFVRGGFDPTPEPPSPRPAAQATIVAPRVAPRIAAAEPPLVARMAPVQTAPRVIGSQRPIVIQPLEVEPLQTVMPVALELMEMPMPLRAESVEIEPLVIQ